MEYKCLESRFYQVKKKIEHVIKKLDKLGINYTFERLENTIEEVAYYNETDRTYSKSYTTICNYEFSMGELKIGDYKIVAVIDHKNQSQSNNINVVNMVDYSYTVPYKYITSKGNCDHCNTIRNRNKTIILVDSSGNFVQVGSTCLNEFTGISCLDIVKGYVDLDVFCYEESKLEDIESSAFKPMFKTFSYLCRCIENIDKYGYQKDETKNKSFNDVVCINNVEQKAVEVAQKVISYFKNLGLTYNNFSDNIVSSLSRDYIEQPNGFIAYAYVQYKKSVEQNNKNNETKHFNGEIGKRYTIENLKVELVTSYPTSYSYYKTILTYMYRLTSNDGIIFIWKTQNEILDRCITVLGTIKEFNEYNGIKQTILTRCKIK